MAPGSSHMATQEWEAHRETIERLYKEAEEAEGVKDSDKEEQRAANLAYVQAEMQSKHGFEASISQLEAQLGAWERSAESGGSGINMPASSFPSAPPSPAQAGVGGEPDWIMISTFSRLGLPEQNNISFPQDTLREWSSLPTGQLEEQFRSRGINLKGGLSQELVASLLSPSATEQARFDSFLPEENTRLINGDEMFETSFVRLLVFSMLNGFAGLSEIPMHQILKFLGRLVIHSVFLRILEESPRHTSRTLADNVFRAAIEAKDAKVVKMLLDRKLVDPDETPCLVNDQKYTPIQQAARLAALDIVNVLVAAGADVNKQYSSRWGLDRLLPMLTTGLCPRDWTRNLQFGAAVTASPAVLETFKILIEAGAVVKLQDVLNAGDAFTDFNLACYLSTCIDPAEHRELFQATNYDGGLEKVAKFTDDLAATTVVLNILEKCKQAGCGECLAAGGRLMEQGAIEAARRGHINLVKLIIDHVNPENVMHTVLAAAIVSGDEDLIQLVLSRKPCLDPPSFNMDIRSYSMATTPLAEAVRAGNDELIKLCEEAGALDRLTEGDRFQPLLVAAIEAGNLPYVEDLVARAKTSKQSYRDNGLALAEAIDKGDEKVIWLLLDAGFETSEEVNGRGLTLTAALEKQNAKLVRAIVEAGLGSIPSRSLNAAIEWCDPSVLSDLMAGYFEGIHSDAQAMVLLCKRCMETERVPFFRHFVEHFSRVERDELINCLTLAIEMGHAEMVQQLLDMGVNRLAPGPIQAAINHHPEFMQQLCEAAGPPQKPLRSIGAAALKYVMADAPGNSETLERLLETGSVNLFAPQWLSLDQRWNHSWFGGMVTPLGLAIQGVPVMPETDVFGRSKRNTLYGAAEAQPCGPNLQAIQRLLQAGSDPNGIARASCEGRNRSPLMLAVKTGRADVVELLIRHGADVNQAPSLHTWRSPLQYAAAKGRLDMVRLLLRHGADPNIAPHIRGGGTPLQFAAITGSCPVAAELLHHGALLGALPSKVDGRWPLEAAAEHGRLDMIRFLWDVHASALASGVCHDGFTERHCLRAMNLAREHGHLGCLTLIEELSGVERGRLDTDEYGAEWLAY